MRDKYNECGPVYGVPLIQFLPLGKGSMIQAMPSRRDLSGIRNHGQGERVVAGYEVLLANYQAQNETIDQLIDAIIRVISGEFNGRELHEILEELSTRAIPRLSVL